MFHALTSSQELHFKPLVLKNRYFYFKNTSIYRYEYDCREGFVTMLVEMPSYKRPLCRTQSGTLSHSRSLAIYPYLPITHTCNIFAVECTKKSVNELHIHRDIKLEKRHGLFLQFMSSNFLQLLWKPVGYMPQMFVSAVIADLSSSAAKFFGEQSQSCNVNSTNAIDDFAEKTAAVATKTFAAAPNAESDAKCNGRNRCKCAFTSSTNHGFT